MRRRQCRERRDIHSAARSKVDRQMRGRLIIRCFDNGHEVIRAEGRVLVDDLAAKVLDLLVYAGNALGIFVQGMSPLGCQRAQQNVGWHDALLAVIVVSYGKLVSGKRSDSAPGQSTPTAPVRLRLTAEAGQRIGYYTRA